MKKSIFVFIFLVIQGLLFGQGYNTTIGVKLSPGFATSYGPIIENTCNSRFSASAGLEVRQRIFKDILFLESGLSFIDRGYKKNQFLLQDINGNELQIEKVQDYNYYLSLPISLVFKHKGFFVGAGANINYYLARRHYYDGKLTITDKPDQENNIIFGMQIFLGYEMKLSDRFIISLDAYASPTFKVKYFNYGLGIGLKYVLKKHEK